MCQMAQWTGAAPRNLARGALPHLSAPTWPCTKKLARPHTPSCSEGGTSIEDLAEKYPDKIIKIPVDVRTGITDEQAMQVG